MKYITSTQLRTKSKELVDALRDGDSITLIHRSQEVGVISPPKVRVKPKKFDAEAFREAAKKLNLNVPTSYEERDRLYREAMMKKHG